jgi:hypothetical protein
MVSYLTEDEVDEEVISTFIPRPKIPLLQTTFLRKRLDSIVPVPIVNTKVSWKEEPLSDSEDEEDSEIDYEPEKSVMTSCTLFLLCALVLSMSIVPPLVVSLTR